MQSVLLNVIKLFVLASKDSLEIHLRPAIVYQPLLRQQKLLIHATHLLVDQMPGALRETVLLPASVYQSTLEIHMLHVDQSVLLMLTAPAPNSVGTKSVLIPVQVCVAPMPTAKLPTTSQSACATKGTLEIPLFPAEDLHHQLNLLRLIHVTLIHVDPIVIHQGLLETAVNVPVFLR